MKTQNLSSEKNGISIAVNVGLDKPIYCSPAQLAAVLEPTRAESLRQQLASIDPAELAAIDSRAASTPEARKLARVTEERNRLQAAVSAATTEQAKQVAELSLQLFELKNKAA